MKKVTVLLILALFSYLVLIVPFAHHMHVKPVHEKLGFVPTVPVVKVMAADQRELVAASLVMKVLMYFGGITGKSGDSVRVPADYPSMSRIIHGSVQLDPYNMDAYYFAQAILVWDVGKVDIANALLDYGMRFRTWDWYLPFFAGFNNAYFLKDYSAAAKYYRKAGELSGSDLFVKLAGRYMQGAGQTELAIAYLSSMLKGEKNPAIKESYRIRLLAFKEARRIEIARDRYRETTGKQPESVERLIADSFLTPPPVDPYGGRFYLEADGKVSTTSKFAFTHRKTNGSKTKLQRNH